MRTTFRARQPYADILLACANESGPWTPCRPKRFIEKMRSNQGVLGFYNGMGLDSDGLERKNPVIATLGDSVTAGHFEFLLPNDPEKVQEYIRRSMAGEFENGKRPPVEITDARESYIEKFRGKLIDQFETTSVSVINGGIAGDDLRQMAARMYRDVIRYQPDLVLINGSLNWNDAMGTTADYKEILVGMVSRIKHETDADIILLTPNGDLPNNLFSDEEPKPLRTAERAQAIREVAVEENVCLADVYQIWETARERGCPWEELLANGFSHPGVEGHEVYAIALMKLFEE